VAAVLEVDAAGQRRDVAAASAAPTATTAQPGMVAEMGARLWRRKWLVGLAKAFSAVGGRVRGGQGRTREDACTLRADANSAQI
jgi:hypothetical protein